MRVGLLGQLEVEDGGRGVEVSGGRLQALLARLALDSDRAVRSASLVDAVWEEELPADAAHALQALVSRLRRSLGDAALVAQTPGGYRLAVAPDAVDAHRFERLARAGADALRDGDPARAASLLRDALALWRGPALAGLADERRFAAEAAERLERLRLGATLDRIDADVALDGAGAAVVAELERLATEHPLDERVGRRLIRVLAAVGRQADALTAYERIRASLADELGAAPSPELQAAHLAVLRGEAAPAPARPRTNLRVPLTSFVGRAAELEAIGVALAEQRLVTLVGPGGAGKTRLAQEATARWVDRMPDGVWLVELAPVTEDAEIPHALLDSLRLRGVTLIEPGGRMPAGDALRRVFDAIADWRAVIVLDNCEHLVAAAAAVADELLGRCRGVRLVATSREPLGIVGELLLEVAPLALPAATASAEEALAHPAVQLFADRAAAASRGFRVDGDSVAAVVEICRRLDGLPLAIEIAAARLRSLPAQEIARRLDDRFRLLTGGSRTAMPRHRTLRAVVDWSWDLLGERERALARRLAIFPGGATPDSAEAVCASADLPGADMLDLLAALVDRSLVHVVDGPRYRMLETIREYARERLGEAGELDALGGAHARHFAALVDDLEPQLRGAGQIDAYAVLSAERENVIAALRHLADRGHTRAALRLAVSLLWFALLEGDPATSIGWMRLALATEGDADPGDRAIAAVVAAVPDAAGTGRGPQMVDSELLAAPVARLAAADTTHRPLAALLEPLLAWLQGDRERGERLLARACRHADPWVRAAAPLMRAQLAENDGEVEAMRGDLARALAGFRIVGDRWGIAMTLLSQAAVRMLDGDLDAASSALEEAGELSAAFGGRPQDAMLAIRVAEVRLRRGDAAGARDYLRRVEERGDLRSEETMMLQAMRCRAAWVAGDREEARALRDALVCRLDAAAMDPQQDRHRKALALAAVGWSWLADGDLDAAERALDVGHDAALATADQPILAVNAVAVAALAERRGDAAAAAEILGAAASLRGADDPNSPEIAALTARLRAALGGGAFDVAYAGGRALDRAAARARVRPLRAPAVRP
jgi:predicted ATPase/DNA-binding SARP family transcriptional activator